MPPDPITMVTPPRARNTWLLLLANQGHFSVTSAIAGQWPATALQRSWREGVGDRQDQELLVEAVAGPGTQTRFLAQSPTLTCHEL